MNVCMSKRRRLPTLFFINFALDGFCFYLPIVLRLWQFEDTTDAKQSEEAEPQYSLVTTAVSL